MVLVVLTGMGRDGLEGAKAVKAAGGRVLVEAESTCTVYGMPRAVAEAGPGRRGPAARRAGRRDRPRGRAMSTLSERIAARQAAVRRRRRRFAADIKADDFTALCELVRRLCGVDLLQYKRGQMERRVRTFAQRRGTPELAAYGLRLKADADELDAFLDRVTINVSHLWRHEDQWTALGKTILPELAAAAAASAAGAPARPTAPRRTRWRRSPQELDPGRARRDPRHRPRPPDGRAGPRGHVLGRGRPHRAASPCCNVGSCLPMKVVGRRSRS